MKRYCVHKLRVLGLAAFFLGSIGRRLLLVAMVSPIALFLLSGFSDPPVRVMDMSYSIDPGSSLAIAGTSNVNSFNCFCNENFIKRPVKVTSIDSSMVLRLSNAVLKLPTKTMDCNNSRMNSDLCDALKADQYPYIVIELHEVNLSNLNRQALKGGEWRNVVAIATLTITNVCRPLVLDVRAQQVSPGHYHFVSSKDLKMTDFKVDPPTALFGLIKVHNEINIKLDLYATITNP